MDTERTRCLIVGSGPAGYTAAIYAARECGADILLFGHTHQPAVS
jgi:thioredoxin reductase (NADPH)